MDERAGRMMHDRRTLLQAAVGGVGVAIGGGLAPVASAAHQQPSKSAPHVEGPFWPDGARLVISMSMQFEAGAQGERDNGAPFPPVPENVPDLIGRSWFAYGVREGIPRLLDLFDRRRVKVTSHMVGRAVELSPALAREIVDRGHEAAAHGHTWTPHWTLAPAEERASYQANVAAIEKATGIRPVGFNAYWMRGTAATLEILQDLGFIYHIDDLSRDEPSIAQVRGHFFAVVPYTYRNNDIGRLSSWSMSASAFAQELKDEFDVLYAEGGRRRRMMSISTHDRFAGVPAVVKNLEDFIKYAQSKPGVVFMRKDEIARFALSSPSTPPA